VLSLSSASLLDYGTSRRVLARRPPPCTCTSTVLIPGTWQEEPEDRGGGHILSGRSDAHRYFTVYLFDPCFRVLLAWDE